jgi:transcriptional regulator with XRE-family HTH domain
MFTWQTFHATKAMNREYTGLMDIASLYKDFGRRLKTARKSAGMTQETLAAQVGLSRASITNIERGRQHIHVHTMFLICYAVGVHPSNLLMDMEPPQKKEIDKQRLTAVGLSNDGLAWVQKIIASNNNNKETEQ